MGKIAPGAKNIFYPRKWWRKSPRREIRSQQSFNDTIEPKSTSSKTQIVFLIYEGDYGNTGAKTTAINPKNDESSFMATQQGKNSSYPLENP